MPPLAAWIAGAAALGLLGALWFDWLFEIAGAKRVRSLADHLGARSILAVFAHPDDEVLTAGALADAAAREGVAVRTVTLTRGENGYPQPAICTREELPRVREEELRRYGRALGIGHQEVWEYPDGGLAAAPAAEVAARLAARIRDWKPDLVLTFDPHGGYTGHKDHRACGALATEAARLAGDPALAPEPGAAHRVRHLAYILVPRRAFSTFGWPELRAAAAAQPAADLAVPVAARLRILGLRTHASQHIERAFRLPAWLLFAFWDKEHYSIIEAGAAPARPAG